MPEPQSWTSVIIPSLALLAVILFGVLNLLRARRGPNGSPAWSIEHMNKARYQLIQSGTADARHVQVSFEPAEAQVRMDTEFDIFRRGERVDMLVMAGWGTGAPKIVVTWDGKRGKRERWASDLP